MISMEKTRQSLKSLNLTVAILNGIFAAIALIVAGFATLGYLAWNSSEMRQQVEANMTPEQVLAMQQSNPVVEIGSILVLVTIYLVVMILAIRNRKKIDRNQPSLLPYYIGIGGSIFNLSTYLISGSMPTIVVLLIQVGLLTLYAFAVKKAKVLLENGSTEQTDSLV